MHFIPIKKDDAVIEEAFRDYLNDLQLKIASWHQQVAETWFDV